MSDYFEPAVRLIFADRDESAAADRECARKRPMVAGLGFTYKGE